MSRSGYRIAVLVAMLLVARQGAAAPASLIPESKVELIRTADCIVVGLRDFDVMLNRFEALNGEFALRGADGKTIDSCRFDYRSPVGRSHLVLLKRKGVRYQSIVVVLRDGDRKLLDATFPLPETLAVQAPVALTKQKAYVVSGSGAEGQEAPPHIALPDLSKARRLETAPPPRTVDLQQCVRPVRSDSNIPQIGSNNNSIVSRQTAHPDDPAKKSLYISIKAPLFDQVTGNYDSNLKFLVEIPLEEGWIRGDDDATVFVPVEKLRAHMTDETLDVFRLGRQRVTGSREGGLMQLTRSVVKDEDGNLYFAMLYRSPIRFNISKARWERPPLNVYEWLLRFKPKIAAGLPYDKNIVDNVRFDFPNGIFYHQGRIYVSLSRYAIFGKTFTVACVVSIPTDHWSDGDQFGKGIRLNAGSWPNSDFPLFDEYVNPEDRLKKLAWAMAVGNRLCLLSYHRNYLWALDLEADGSTRRLAALRTVGGKAITRFGYPDWLFSGGECVGLKVPVRLEGAKEDTPAFLANDSSQLSAELPEKTRARNFRFNHPGPIRGEKIYGRTQLTKRQVGSWLGKYNAAGKGKLTLCYDVVGRLRAHPGKFAHLIEMMNGPSFGPAYHLVSLPGKTTQVMGNAEYISYYHSLFDCSGAAGDPVRKDYLKLDAGETGTNLGVGAGLGPGCHTWVRNEEGDDVLYYAGYPGGICRMTYRRKGGPLDRFKVDILTSRLRHAELDGAPPAYVMWLRAMAPGLGDKILVTGVGQANRGGTAYSGGLMYFHRKTADRLYKLSRMSVSYKTTRMSWRVIMRPGAGAEQDIFLGGNYSGTYALTIPEKDRPANTQPRIFAYRDSGGDRIRDLFAFSLVPGDVAEPALQDIAMSRNQLYLLILHADGALASFDPAAWRFMDVVKTSPRRIRFQGYRTLLPMPDGNHVILAFDDEKKTSATFSRIVVDAAGKITVQPLLKCTSGDPDLLPTGRYTACAFLYDHRNDDGSYDLVLGPDPAKRRTWIMIIRDLVPPRKDL